MTNSNHPLPAPDTKDPNPDSININLKDGKSKGYKNNALVPSEDTEELSTAQSLSQPHYDPIKDMAQALKTIDIVDELIHGITRRHIPDYPEATVAINKIDQLLATSTQQAVIAELEKVANHNNSEYTSDYLEARISELKAQLKLKEKEL